MRWLTMHACGKCMKIGGAVFLVLGVLFLLRDLGVWNFWNIQWWTVLFLLVGLIKFKGCKDCEKKK